jgi:hypothetical protein
MASNVQRVSVGFFGAQVLALRLRPEVLEALREAVKEGQWHDVDAEDGSVRLNTAQVVYVRVESDEHRVGFGG